MVRRFLGFVEIRTKLASVLPFLLGFFYAIWTYSHINWLNTLLFFISMVFFDMTTTALNNYIDAKVNGAPLEFQLSTAKRILLLLLGLATISGLWLAWQTGLVVLVIGAICFMVGILYTFGPASISHMPFGEIFSGVFMGFFIPFLTVYINAPADSLIDYGLRGVMLSINFNLLGLSKLILLTIPAICQIAGIMLANNLCDLAGDIHKKRFTLPYYLGKKNTLILFAGLNGLSFIAIIAIALLDVLPVYCLFALLAIIPVQKNIRRLARKQDKAETFPLSIQNFVLMMIPLILAALLAILIP